MIRILTDSSALFSIQEGHAAGIDVVPLQISVQGKSYREYEEINARQLYDLILAGHQPTSSLPSLGEVMQYFNSHPNEEILVLCMADGLSGTYASIAAMADTLNLERSEKIHVLNTKTLCGPHRRLVELAVKLRQEGKTLTEIKTAIEEKIETTVSFLLPQDFEFLRRGGRCTAAASKLGSLFKLQPVMIQSNEGRQLDKFALKRSFDLAVKAVINHFEEIGIGKRHRIYISHAFAKEQAEKTAAKLKSKIEAADVVLLELSCVFITQGGPGCIAIQAIQE